MRPRRIARRMIARARHWGTPHVHCPGCGADNTPPEDTSEQTCFTCHIRWFRHDLSGDDAADWASLRDRADACGQWLATWRPLLVDVTDGAGEKSSLTLNCAFVYFPDG